MSRAVILQNIAHEGPGRIVTVFRDFGIPMDIRRLYRGDEVPRDLDEVRVLIVLGGPMSVRDVQDERYPYLHQEVEILRRRVIQDRPVLGICLGAQLLAHAAGAKVYPNTRPGPTPEAPPVPAPEIGWGPVEFPFPGGTDPIVLGLHNGAQMFHWHFDTFDLPKLPPPPPPPPGTPPAAPAPSASSLLSSTRACRNQAFRFKNRLIGFQYHIEMDEAGIEAMLANCPQDVQKVLGTDGRQQIREDTRRHYPQYARLGDRILRNLVQFLKLY
jgi:GMP synthase (glutamine-hydrolysing)